MDEEDQRRLVGEKMRGGGGEGRRCSEEVPVKSKGTTRAGENRG